jgi:hypothetical protein
MVASIAKYSPSPIEELLEADERILWSVRPRAVAYFAQAAASFSLLPFSIVAGIWLYARFDLAAVWWLLPLWVIVLFSARAVVSKLATRGRTVYAATERRLFIQARDPQYFAACCVECVRLRRVQSIEVRRGFVDHLAGTASVVIAYKDEEGGSHVARLTGLTHADDVVDRLRGASDVAITHGAYRDRR